MTTGRRAEFGRVGLIVLCVLVASTQCAYGRGRAPAREFATSIAVANRAVEELRAATHAPGMAVAVGVNGRIVWSAGFGMSNVELSVPATPLSRFRLGSVSKLVTVAAIARLVDEGKLDLDAKISKYVPEFGKNGDLMTVRQVAGHLAGIRHYGSKDYVGRNIDAEHYDTVAASLAIFKDDPLVSVPGEKYNYSTFGYTLLSRVVEVASGQEFRECVRTRVTGPLGLKAMVPDVTSAIVPNRTGFYEATKEGRIDNASYVDPSYKWAGGGMVSSAEDLVRFGSAFLKPGFLTAATLETVMTAQQTADAKPTGVGIGWRVGVDADGNRIMHHAGSIAGGRSALLCYRDKGVVVAIVSNLSNAPAVVDRTALTIGELFLAEIDRGSMDGATRTFAFDGGALTLKRTRDGLVEGRVSGGAPFAGVGVGTDGAIVVGVARRSGALELVVATSKGLFPLECVERGGGWVARLGATLSDAPVEVQLRR